jgi:hypothetical protein
MWAGRAVLPLPACGERDGVRGLFRKRKLANQSLWRGPLTRNLRDARANSDLSPQAGRGEGLRPNAIALPAREGGRRPPPWGSDT